MADHCYTIQFDVEIIYSRSQRVVLYVNKDENLQSLIWLSGWSNWKCEIYL